MFQKRSPLRSGKLAKKRRRMFLIKITAILTVLAGVMAGSIYGLHRPEVTIQNISVQGNESLSAQGIQEIVEQELTGKYFFLFPKRSIVLYPRERVEAAVLEEYKRVEEIEISRSGLQALSVHISEREPFAAWCTERHVVLDETASSTERSSPIDTTCYFLDDRGFIFTDAPRFTGNVYFRYYGAVPDDDPIGKQFLTEELFTQVTFFLDAVDELDLGVTSLRVSEHDYHFELSPSGEILVGRDQNFREAITNLESVVTSEVFRESDLSALEYIDLRFGNRVFYRFKE